MNQQPDAGTVSLAEEQREVTRTRIRRAAMSMLAERGFRATIDDIAAAAGVSPRTVFRHYAGADQLVAEAVDGLLKELGRPVAELPDPAVDLRGWIEGLALAAHSRNTDTLGKVFWDIHNPPPGTSPVVLEALSQRRSLRARWMTYIVDRAWKTAGGAGPVPPDLFEVFSIHFSAYITYALAADFEHTPGQAARMTTHILMTMLESAVARAPA